MSEQSRQKNYCLQLVAHPYFSAGCTNPDYHNGRTVVDVMITPLRTTSVMLQDCLERVRANHRDQIIRLHYESPHLFPFVSARFSVETDPNGMGCASGLLRLFAEFIEVLEQRVPIGSL